MARHRLTKEEQSKGGKAGLGVPKLPWRKTRPKTAEELKREVAERLSKIETSGWPK